MLASNSPWRKLIIQKTEAAVTESPLLENAEVGSLPAMSVPGPASAIKRSLPPQSIHTTSSPKVRLNNSLDSDSLAGYAEALNLDMERWLLDMDSDAIEAKIEEDFKIGVRSGANGTPTFFLNSFRYDGDLSYEPFLEAIASITVARALGGL